MLALKNLFFFFLNLGMATMKGNKGKEVASEGDRPEAGDARPDTVPQTRPCWGQKEVPTEEFGLREPPQPS